jgi:hypothetical protein
VESSAIGFAVIFPASFPKRHASGPPDVVVQFDRKTSPCLWTTFFTRISTHMRFRTELNYNQEADDDLAPADLGSRPSLQKPQQRPPLPVNAVFLSLSCSNRAESASFPLQVLHEEIGSSMKHFSAPSGRLRTGDRRHILWEIHRAQGALRARSSFAGWLSETPPRSRVVAGVRCQELELRNNLAENAMRPIALRPPQLDTHRKRGSRVAR